MGKDLEARAVDVVRGLAMDAVQQANSGHPGTPMALAPLAHVLFTRILRYDASAPDWFDRDRFILSAGHASMLQYAMLHLTGFGLTLDDVRAFRQWGSRTPGHPENVLTTGVEVTTGPLGQGFANGVGMAVAERWLRERFGPEVCDHRVFAICSDGDLEEGISHEAASLAGHLGLGRLVYVYDDNHITIDGVTELALSDDTALRFEAYGWHVVDLGEASEDLDAIEAGLRAGVAEEARPTLVILRSHIGYPSPNKTDDPAAHGAALGLDEVRATKEILGLPPDETFHVPADVLAFYRDAGARGTDARRSHVATLDTWRSAHPEDAAELDLCLAGAGRDGWEQKLPQWEAGESVATRKANQAVMNAMLDVVPGLLGGSADLEESNGVKIDSPALRRDAFTGHKLHFGVREHAMGAIANGAALHGGALPFTATFLIFSDYQRPAIRLAALSHAKVAFVFSHDSVGLGEDGPTHQPIEHLAALRAVPGLTVLRPADANETAHAWRLHVDGSGPTVIVVTRQNVPVLDGTSTRGAEGVPRGAYVLVDEVGQGLDLVLVGTGSEVALCAAAAAVLAERGLAVRVVSMPSWERFAAQDDAYRAEVLPAGVPSLAVEAASSFGWDRWTDDAVSIDRFGASAPGGEVLAHLGYTVDNVVARATALLERMPR
jgi:transketolase